MPARGTTHLVAVGIDIGGSGVEGLAAATVRTDKHLSRTAWSERLNAYLAGLESLLSPDLIILGGGISKNHAEFLARLRARAGLVPAQLYDDAGIVGAVLAAHLTAGAEWTIR